jgi:hypothetical protein
MNTYHFHASHGFPQWNYRFAPTLTSDLLVQTLADIAVRELVASKWGGYNIELQCERANHHEAVADINAALAQLGFDTAQVLITEWATSMVEGALVGGAGGGAIGSAAKNPWAVVFGAVVGLLVGSAVGSGMNTIKAMYRADRINPHRYGWQFTQLQISQADGGGHQWFQA